MPDSEHHQRPVLSRRPCLMAILRMSGLRPTKQRMALAELLFGGQHQHVSAEDLHQKAMAADVNVSLATVYNTLHQFCRAGLLRDVTVDASCCYFDTDTSDHYHFYVEDEQCVVDIPVDSLSIQGLPPPPRGTQITHVDVVVRVRRIAMAGETSRHAHRAGPRDASPTGATGPSRLRHISPRAAFAGRH